MQLRVGHTALGDLKGLAMSSPPALLLTSAQGAAQPKESKLSTVCTASTSWCSSSLARTARRWASLASDARQITATSVPTDIITLV